MGEAWYIFIKGMFVLIWAFLYPFIYVSSVILVLAFIIKLFGLDN